MTVAKNHKSTSTSKSSSSVVDQTDASDPSSFVLDTRLKKSFYGIAYTPEGSQLPDCGNSLGAFPPRPRRRYHNPLTVALEQTK